jgi:transposase-like protein
MYNKSKGDDRMQDKKLQAFRLTLEQIGKLSHMARTQNVTASEIVRQAVDNLWNVTQGLTPEQEPEQPIHIYIEDIRR